MRTLASTGVLAITLLGVNPPREVPPFARELPEVPSGPPAFAFNGKDLAGFYTFTRFHKYEDPEGVFTVLDGMIHVSGREFGGLATVESYSDYRLIVEWKWGTKTWYPRRHRARNSGVMVHSIGPDGDAFASWMASIECQILEGGSGDLIVAPSKQDVPRLTSECRTGADGQVYYCRGGTRTVHQAGRINWWGRDPDWQDVLWSRGPDDVEKPFGEWNRAEIVCQGDAITYVLNGVLMNAATGARWTAGKVLLQSEGAEIYFRKFEIRPLIK